MKRLAEPRAAGAVLVLVIALCVLLTTVSNAAGLSILAQSGGVFAQTTERCTDAELAVTPSGTPNSAGDYNRVTVSGDFGSCTGGDVSLYLKDSPFTVLFSEPITISGSSVEVTTSSYFDAPESDDGEIVLGLNGWLIPASWTHIAPVPQGPVTPGENIEVIGGSPDWTITGVGNQFCFTASVRGISSTPTTWTLDLHVAQRPFNGRTTNTGLQLDHWNGYQWVSSSAINGTLQITGTGAKATITSSQQYAITVCDYAAPTPFYDPSLDYTVTTTAPALVGTEACMSVTVAVSGSPLFYAGWRADVDFAQLFALKGGSGTVSVTKTNGSYRAELLSGTTYRLTGSAWDVWTVRDDAPRTFVVCVT